MLNVVSFIDLESWIARVYQGQRVLIKPWFINTDFSVANGATQTNTLKINSNADFVLTDIRSDCQYATREITVQIIDNGSLERFFANPIPLVNLIGKSLSAQVNTPSAINTYRRISGNSSLNIEIVNGAAASQAFSMSLVGALVYPYSGA